MWDVNSWQFCNDKASFKILRHIREQKFKTNHQPAQIYPYIGHECSMHVVLPSLINLESFGFSRCWWLNVLHAAHSLPSCHVSHILLLLSANCLAHFIVFMHASLIWVEDLTLVICEKHNPWKKPKYIWLVTHHSSQSNNIYILLCLIAWKVIGSNEVRNNGFSTRILGGRKETFRLQ